MRPTVEIPSNLLLDAIALLTVEGTAKIPNADRVLAELEALRGLACRPLFHIEGRRWFSRGPGPGNTYHRVRIFKDGERLVTLPMQYGYGDQYLDTAVTWLKLAGHIPQDAKGNTLYIRETLHSTYEVTDVARMKDLH